MAFLKSYKWILPPFSSYEIRRELRVRESRHTVMLWDKKYYDIDSGKFISDKLQTINSYHLSDFIDDCVHNHMRYTDFYREKREEEQYSRIFNIPKFAPKDDDFDEEEKREKEEQKRLQKQAQEIAYKNQINAEKIRQRKEEDQKRVKQEIEKKIKRLEEEMRIKEENYQKQVKEAEIRAKKWFISQGYDSIKNLPPMIRPNSWKPK